MYLFETKIFLKNRNCNENAVEHFVSFMKLMWVLYVRISFRYFASGAENTALMQIQFLDVIINYNKLTQLISLMIKLQTDAILLNNL